MNKTVEPTSVLEGQLQVPGDKSISHRLAMLTGLAHGSSTITGFLTSEDCLNTLEAIEKLGAGVERDGSHVRVEGTAGHFRNALETLDLGNSGTGLRLLTGILAGHTFTTELTGDASLRSRPMDRIKTPLEKMGASIALLGKSGGAPIRVSGGPLRGIPYALPMSSAQVKSCVLLAGLFAEGPTTIIEKEETRDHTELLLRHMGIRCKTDGLSVSLEGGSVDGPSIPGGSTWDVPGDFSAAGFWITAAACREKSDIELLNVGLNPRRTALLGVLERMGADIAIDREDDEASWEPRGVIRVRGAELVGTEVVGDEIPNLIDELPLVAVAGAMSRGKTVIRGAEELRHKESDRISTVVRGLRALGVKVEEQSDGMDIEGVASIRGNVSIESSNDHRIAMSMAVLALSAASRVEIANVQCIGTSYPQFWRDMNRLTGRNS